MSLAGLKRETFNLTPNITPIKDIVPEKKILVRSFSKGNLMGMPPTNTKNTPTVSSANSGIKKTEKTGSAYGIFYNSIKFECPIKRSISKHKKKTGNLQWLQSDSECIASKT